MLKLLSYLQDCLFTYADYKNGSSVRLMASAFTDEVLLSCFSVLLAAKYLFVSSHPEGTAHPLQQSKSNHHVWKLVSGTFVIDTCQKERKYTKLGFSSLRLYLPKPS